MEQAVVYARYSSHNQNEMSIEGQIKAAEEYAARNGLVIIRTYEDRAKSGTNDRRPGFQKMLEDCKKHEFSVIIVWKVDRFGRNKEEITFNKYKCKKEGVKVVYVAESIGEGNEAVILESVLEGMAEYYSKQLSTNVKRGQAIAKAKGYWHGGNPPTGMMVVDKKLVPDPNSYKLVENIFNDFLNGSSELSIGKKNNMYNTTIHRILRNKVYRGSIIDEELFDVIQRKLDLRYHRRETVEEHRQEYVLSTKLFCKLGHKMKGVSTNHGKFKYYRCPICAKTSVRKDEAEEEILDAVRTGLSNSENIVEGVWNAYTEYKSKYEAPTMPLERIRKAEKGIENIMKAIEQGMDYSLVKERLEALQKDKMEAECEIEEYKNQYNLKLTKEEIRKYLSKSLEVKEPIALLDRYVNRINLVDGGFEIKLNISPDVCLNKQWGWRMNIKTKSYPIPRWERRHLEKKESPCN